jgi:hypothetical protein
MSTETAVFQANSVSMLETKKTGHEYTLEGRSRASYKSRWATKLGRICGTKLGKIVLSMSEPTLQYTRKNTYTSIKMLNDWFCRPWIVLSDL